MIQLTQIRARLILAGLLLTISLGISNQRSIAPPARDGTRFIGDTALQLSTIERIRDGEPYYAAVGDQLRKHRYPSTSIFNWRTPLLYELVAALSIERAGLLLSALGLCVVVTGALAYAQYSVVKALGGALLLLTAVAPAILVRPGAVGFSEHWASMLIGLSLNAYLVRWWTAGAALGAASVFFRELSGPYALVCGLLALRAKRTREFTVWAVGGVVYAAYFVAHAVAVSAAINPGDLEHTYSWVRFLGLPFVFMTLYTHGALSVLPAFATPVAAALGLAGAWARPAPDQLKLAVLVYFVLFCAVGQPFNYYWGYLTATIWGHAFVHSAEGLWALIRCAIARQDAAGSGVQPVSG
jgi:hypothetical protein